jgi:D-alanine-D-alanine ligase-like ATP-grasp enzyme
VTGGAVVAPGRRVAVVALDLAQAPPGRGDELWEPPAPAAGDLDPAAAVALLARALGHAAEVVRVSYEGLDRLLALECDLAVDLAAGLGRDGYPGVEVGEALAARGIPVAGASREFLVLALDKARARARLARRGVAVARGVVLEGPPAAGDLDPLRPPLVVKPREGGGSVGIDAGAVAPDLAAARARAAAAAATYGGVLVEELVAGPELSVALVGTGEAARALPAVEVAWREDVAPSARLLSFDDKHAGDEEDDGRWWLECPPRAPAAAVDAAVEAARRAYAALGGSGHGRVDLRLGPEGPVVLEVNPNPSLEPVLRRADRGLYARALGAAGLPLAAWLDLLLADALGRRPHQRR